MISEGICLEFNRILNTVQLLSLFHSSFFLTKTQLVGLTCPLLKFQVFNGNLVSFQVPALDCLVTFSQRMRSM